MNRKTKFLIALVSATILAGTVYAAILASYIVPSDVIITVAPGITVLDANNQPLTVLHWGDVQRGTSKDFQIKIRNTAGTQVLYVKSSSLTHDLPSGIGTLTWDFLRICPEDYYGLEPGGGTFPDSYSSQAILMLTLTVRSDAPEGPAPFTITFNTYDSAQG